MRSSGHAADLSVRGHSTPHVNPMAKIALSTFLLVALLLWSALWWVMREGTSPKDANVPVTPAVKAPIDAAPPSPGTLRSPNTANAATASTDTTSHNTPGEVRPGAVAAAEAPSAISTTPLASTLPPGAMPHPSKPPSAPIPQLPPPVKPDAQGVVDLSSDPSTRQFSEALREGYARRLAEQARGAQGVAAPEK